MGPKAADKIPRMRRTLKRAVLAAVALGPFGLLLSAHPALAQVVEVTPKFSITPSKTVTPWVFQMAVLGVALGVLIILFLTVSYLRFAPKFYGRKEVAFAGPPGTRPTLLATTSGRPLGASVATAPRPAPPAAKRPAPPVRESPAPPATEPAPHAEEPSEPLKEAAEPTAPPEKAPTAAVTSATNDEASAAAETAQAEPAASDEPAPEAETALAEAEASDEAAPAGDGADAAEAASTEVTAGPQGEPAVQADAVGEAEAAAPEDHPSAKTAEEVGPNAAQTPEEPPKEAPAQASPSGGMDQETFDRVLKEQLATGVNEKVAEGRARAAAIVAARKKSQS
jgi:hypothetical protein